MVFDIITAPPGNNLSADHSGPKYEVFFFFSCPYTLAVLDFNYPLCPGHGIAMYKMVELPRATVLHGRVSSDGDAIGVDPSRLAEYLRCAA